MVNESIDKMRFSQCAIMGVWGQETLAVIYDLRWMLVLIFLLVISDFWWGRSESNMRYTISKENGDRVGIEAYRFRWSRAMRRTGNKIADYMTFLLIGTVVGMAITEHFGVLDHIQTAAIGASIAVIIELVSIWGHVKVVRHLGGKADIIEKMATMLLRKKSQEIGQLVEEVIKESNNPQTI